MSKVIALAACAIALMVGLAVFMVAASQPKASAQLHNAYWPFSVETSVKDR